MPIENLTCVEKCRNVYFTRKTCDLGPGMGYPIQFEGAPPPAPSPTGVR